MFKNPFKSNKSEDFRLPVDDIRISIEEQEYKLTNLSHSGFAIEGTLKPRVMDMALRASLKLSLQDQDVEVSCRAQIIWQHNAEAELAFFSPTRRETMDIAHFIESKKMDLSKSH